MSVTATILSTENLGGGQKRVRASLLLDNAYPSTGYTLTPAMFGLNYFSPNKAGTALLDPTVNLVSGAVLLARVVSQKLLLSYPTGGAGTNPTTPAAPKAATGASTASAVDATTPNLVPGVGKDLPNASDASAVTVNVTALGY